MAEASRSIFLASRNPKKLAEMQRILREHLPEIRVLGLDDVAAYDEPVEDAPDFDGNALLKARVGFEVTGLPTLADDSGLVVDALNGMPGVLSARWSGGLAASLALAKDDANNALLLAQLSDTPDERRTARFHASVAFVHAGGELVIGGDMEGRVIREQRGTGGFGYDVLFVPDEQDAALTSAEMTAAQKDAISHRGRSLRRIAPQVVDVVMSLGDGAGAHQRRPNGG